MQPLARWHGCCERLKGEHLPHHTEPLRQLRGRCRRRCTCRRPAGNGSDVQEVCSGRVFAVKTNVALQSHVKSWRRQLVGQCALRLELESRYSELIHKERNRPFRPRSRTDTKAVAPMAVLTRRRNERIAEQPKREVSCGVSITQRTICATLNSASGPLFSSVLIMVHINLSRNWMQARIVRTCQ